MLAINLLEATTADWLHFGLAVAITIILYLAAKAILNRQAKGNPDATLTRSLILLTILLIGIITIIINIPMDSSTKGNITSLLGIVLSAVFALSSATFIGNALAGIMLRAINNFKPGDYITINQHTGRISERGLFHTEIQTPDRNLTTLPNLYLATNPVSVTRASGTFITAEVSLGYDVSHHKIEPLLLQAATAAKLSDPYLTITSLGDFSIVYQIHGRLSDLNTLLTAQSKLYAKMLDALHHANIEIASPTFMNQRQVNDITFIPPKPCPSETTASPRPSTSPEKIIFDKAENAKSIEKRKEAITDLDDHLKSLPKEIADTTDPEEKEKLTHRLERFKKLKEQLKDRITTQLDELQDSE